MNTSRKTAAAVAEVIIGVLLVLAAWYVAPVTALGAVLFGVVAVPFLAHGIGYLDSVAQQRHEARYTVLYEHALGRTRCDQCIAGRHHATHHISINTTAWGTCSLAGCQCVWTGDLS